MAALEAAKAEALASMESLEKNKAAVQHDIEKRDVAILRMNRAGQKPPDIARDLSLPISTVRQAIKNAIVRSNRG
jgi:DNA-binding NarL/FixJ family response regulator